MSSFALLESGDKALLESGDASLLEDHGFPEPTTATTEQSTDTASQAVNLPASIAAGDRLVMCLAFSKNLTVNVVTGWTELAEVDFSGGASHMAVLERIADGTEGATVTVTTSATTKWCVNTFRITGAHASTASEVSTIVTGASVSPDPASLNPAGWDVEDTLWIAFAGHDDRTVTLTTYPTNYTNGERVANTTGSAANSAVLLTARRKLAAASEDPGVFTISAAEEWAAYTIAIRPAAAGGGGAPAAPQRALLGVGT